MVALGSLLIPTAESTGLASRDGSPLRKGARRRLPKELIIFREDSGGDLDQDIDADSELGLNSNQSSIFSASNGCQIQYTQYSSAASDDPPIKPPTSRRLPVSSQKSEEKETATTDSSEVVLSQPPNNAVPPLPSPPSRDDGTTPDGGNDSSVLSIKPVRPPSSLSRSTSTSSQLASRLSKILPSAGRLFERKDTTAASAPSRTEPKDGAFTVPISDRNKVYRFHTSSAAHLYVGLEDQILPPARHLDRWRKYVEPRLWTDISALQRKLKQTRFGRRLPPPAVSLELRMSGYAAAGSGLVELAPCIWILYNENQWKKEFKKFVHESEWLRHEGFGRVEVRRGSPRLSTLSSSVCHVDGLDLRPERSFHVPGGLHLYLHVEVGSSCSANGLVCCATVTDPTNETILGQHISRIGGLISVNGRNMATTTAHGMLKLCWDLAATASESANTEHEDSAGEDDEDRASLGASEASFEDAVEDWDDDDDDDDDDESEDSCEYGTQEGASWAKIAGKVDYASLKSWQTVQVHGMTSFLGMYGLDPGSILPPGTLVGLASGDSSNSPESPLSGEQRGSDRLATVSSNTDYSLWYLPDNGRLKNGFRAPGDAKRTRYINERSSPDIDSCTDVLIILRPGEILEGRCIPGYSYFAVNGVRFRTRKIRLDALIALGCSGSWVLVGDKFCGVIIACYEHEPYAHMIPCDELFDHARDLISGASYIKLPLARRSSSRSNVTTGTSKSSSEPCALNASLWLNSAGSQVEKGPARDSHCEERKRLDRATQSFLRRKFDIIRKLRTIQLKAQHLQAQQRLFPLQMTQAEREEATMKLRDAWKGMEEISDVFEFWYSLTEDEDRAAAIVKTYLQLQSAHEDINDMTAAGRTPQHCQMTMTCEELKSARALVESIADELDARFPSGLRSKTGISEIGILRRRGSARDKEAALPALGSKDATPGRSANSDVKPTFDKLLTLPRSRRHVVVVNQARTAPEHETTDVADVESDSEAMTNITCVSWSRSGGGARSRSTSANSFCSSAAHCPEHHGIVRLSKRGSAVAVLNHHRSNPSPDEPRSDQAYRLRPEMARRRRAIIEDSMKLFSDRS